MTEISKQPKWMENIFIYIIYIYRERERARELKDGEDQP